MNNPVIVINIRDDNKWEAYVDGQLLRIGTDGEIDAYLNGFLEGVMYERRK